MAKEFAAGALSKLSANVDNKVSIAAAGAIQLLVALLQNGTDVAKEMVTITLRNLSSNEDNRVSIAAAGAIPRLVALLMLQGRLRLSPPTTITRSQSQRPVRSRYSLPFSRTEPTWRKRWLQLRLGISPATRTTGSRSQRPVGFRNSSPFSRTAPPERNGRRQRRFAASRRLESKRR